MKDAKEGLSEKLQILIDINQHIAGSLDEQEVLQESLELEKEIVDAETGSILLLDDSGEYLNFTVALGDSGSVLEEHRLKVGEGIAGHVAETKRPVLIEDAETDERFADYFDDETGFDTQTLLCVPILVGDKLLGVAEVINKTDGTAFDYEDLVLFSAFAGQLAVALENARLHEEVLSQEKMRKEIQTARKVQQSYIPDQFPPAEGLQFGAELRSAKTVSGDFYDGFELPDGRVAFLLGDVSGKGMPAAIYACRLITDLRTRLEHGYSISELFNRLNDRLYETSTQGMFVTLLLFLIDSSKNKVEVGNAGHLPFFVLSPEAISAKKQGDNPPLGVTPGGEFSSYDLSLNRNETILAFTDGVTEAKNPDGEMLGMDRARGFFNDTILPPDLLVNKLQLDVEGFCDTADQSDDITVTSFGDPDQNDHFEFEIRAHTRYLGLVRQAIDELLSRRDVDEETLNNVKVGIGEAVNNIIEHTYHNKKSGRIVLTMYLDDSTFHCDLRDFGEPVDPEDLKVCEPNSEEVSPGGLGLHLMHNFFERCAYDSEVTDGNKLIMEKDL